MAINDDVNSILGKSGTTSPTPTPTNGPGTPIVIMVRTMKKDREQALLERNNPAVARAKYEASIATTSSKSTTPVVPPLTPSAPATPTTPVVKTEEKPIEKVVLPPVKPAFIPSTEKVITPAMEKVVAPAPIPTPVPKPVLPPVQPKEVPQPVVQPVVKKPIETTIMVEEPAAPSPAPVPKPISRATIVIVLVIALLAVGTSIYLLLPAIRTIGLPAFELPKISFFNSSTSTPTTTTTTTGEPRMPSIIPAQYETRFTINKETPNFLFERVKSERELGVPEGSIKHLYFEEAAPAANNKLETNEVSAANLITFTGTSIPGTLARTIENTYMVGLIGEGNSVATPFIILNVSSYDTGFAGMLAWERDMPFFINTLFGTNITSSKSTVVFKDTLVDNVDARILDSTNAPTVAYAFTSPTTVVIATSQRALEAIVSLRKTK